MRLSPVKPRNLHISHSWGGGLGQWVDSFCGADRRSENLELRSLGTYSVHGVNMELRHGVTKSPMKTWSLRHPIFATSISNKEYRALLDEIVTEYRVDHVYVSSFIGHALDVLDLAVPITIVHHDHYPYCPRVHAFFGRPCTSCTTDQLPSCIRENSLVKVLQANDAVYWQALRTAYLERVLSCGAQNICPTAGFLGIAARVDERALNLRWKTIPHGDDTVGFDCFGGATETRRLRIVFLGRMAEQKGSIELRRALTRLRMFADVFLVGSGREAGDLAHLTGVTLVRDYNSQNLTTTLASLQPDIAGFTSVVPETFSYTLSEAWAHGLPVCAFDVGSFTDRISPNRDGVVTRPDANSLVQCLIELNAHRQRVRDLARGVRQRPLRSVEDMLDDYYALRHDYLPELEQRLNAYALRQAG